jgi:enamine deaminase RidA (YjgF/YER057c/UK114 family)
MTLECINPTELPTPPTYSHVVVATGTRLVFVAGQEPEDEQGNLVGSGDLSAQAHQVFTNVGRALAAAGARLDQVAKITIYVVGHRPDYLPVIEEACSGSTSVYRSLILADTCGVSRVSEMGCAEVLSAGAVGWSLSHTDAWRAGWVVEMPLGGGVLLRVRL